jgi:alkanesulfonate monooxygenase SsuD/methylene tetrahydromethanopterin reductase-like flavin-dependent oxidoreductase (luciferase family)
VKLGLALDEADPARRLALALEAERRELESVWLRERPGEDPFAALAELAAKTRRVRLAVYSHDLAGRSPLVSAERIAALDRASGGRMELGVSAGDPDAAAEALTLLKRLWCDPWVEHRGARFAIAGVAPSQRPQQRPWSPLHVEGEDAAALALAARSADGWLASEARVDVLAARLERMRELRARAETLDGRFAVSVHAPDATPATLVELERLGVERVLVGARWLGERAGA